MNKLIINTLMFVLIQTQLIAECDAYAQEKANEYYQKALNVESAVEQLSFLQQSLDSCYSPEVEIQVELLKGDAAYDNKEYKKARNHYNDMLKILDQVKDPATRKELHLLSYKCLEDTYKAMNENELASIMRQKYDMRERRGLTATSNTQLVSADTIVRALKLPENFKGVGVTQSVNLYVNYKYDSVEFTDDGIVQAKELALALKELQLDHSGANVEIIGYTDTKGSAKYNLNLSDRRALALKRYLLNNFTFDQLRFVSNGRGESSPICLDGKADRMNGEYHCTGSEDRLRSRRVEVVFGYE